MKKQKSVHAAQVAFIFLSGWLIGTASAKTIFVSTGGSDQSSGATWATAKQTIGAGITAAVSGDQVWVAAGRYVERISLKSGVALYGGFTGNETQLAQRNWTANISLVDSNGVGSVVSATGTSITTSTRIDGFTIANGKGSNGGGVYVYSASPTIANNVIAGCTATSNGGGIYLYSSSAVVANNRITANHTAGAGGGIDALSSSPTLANNAIIGNSAGGGGGISLSSCSGTITNNTICSNGVSYSGGGVAISNSSVKLANTLVAYNSSGIWISGTTLPTLRYCCVYGNTQYNYSGLTDPTGTNGMIRVDPKLADVGYSKVHLQPNSPCIGAGNNNDVLSGWPDMDGQARTIGTTVDIGADESDGTTWPTGPGLVVFISTTGSDANNGLSWSTAKRTVQAGIETAARSGGEVWVGVGTYTGTYMLRAGVALYGGFTGNESQRQQRDWAANETILDGNRNNSVVTARAGATVIDGFTVTKGAFGDSDCGGGISCITSSITVANNKITDNSPGQTGGGVRVDRGDATIVNNTITGNRGGDGAGLYLIGSTATISDNIITNNGADSYQRSGGGIYVHTSTAIITRNTISRNRADNRGGGLYLTSSSASITGNAILGNRAEGAGGLALYYSSPLVANNVIAGNTGWTYGGGGLSIGDSSSPAIINNTITNNSGPTGGAMRISCFTGSPIIANTIIAFNSSGISQDYSNTTPVFRNNCVYGNIESNYSGLTDPTHSNGNISADPRLASPAFCDLHIQPDSPCIGTGSNGDVPDSWVDIDGQPRRSGAIVDIGADESDGTICAVTPEVIRVSPGGNDANDGSSWSLAKRTVQAGISEAAKLRGEVWVAAGSYVERITLPAYAHVFGGFVGTETTRSQRNWSSNITTLDGGANGSVVTALLGIRVSTIDGFTITNGTGTVSMTGGGGGGVYCDCGSPYISNNAIVGNTATAPGGGIACYNSFPLIANNTIAGNQADSGGGISASGGTIVNNTILGNLASHEGGGLLLYENPAIVNNIVAFNSSGVYHGSGGTVIRNNCVYGNTSYNYSGLLDQTGTNGNISVDPGLVDASHRSPRLQRSSLCIDAGDNGYVAADDTDWDCDGDPEEMVPFDVLRQPRRSNDPTSVDTGVGTTPIVDIGSYEYQPPVAADFDEDGYVNLADLDIFLSCATGPAIAYNVQNLPAGCTPMPTDQGFIRADFDQDYDVDSADFAFFQRCWSGAFASTADCAN